VPRAPGDCLGRNAVRHPVAAIGAGRLRRRGKEKRPEAAQAASSLALPQRRAYGATFTSTLSKYYDRKIRLDL
jgi:hypothetical protein